MRGEAARVARAALRVRGEAGVVLGYKANWSTYPVVHITGRRFNPRTTATIDVKVYSNLDSAALTVNGASLPAVTATDHIFVWAAVPLVAGVNQVTATATAGTVTAADTVTWMH